MSRLRRQRRPASAITSRRGPVGVITASSTPTVAPETAFPAELIEVTVSFDPSDRGIEPHPKLPAMLDANPAAREVFDALAPSRQKEIVRYIDGLKSEASVDRNVRRALDLVLGNGRFVGRDRPS
ncbi:MAG: YdeI/OmpD-associated family protein [Actinomycetota bacterium]